MNQSKEEEIRKLYWTMEEAEQITGLAESTIRFYDKELHLNLRRTSKGNRLLTELQIDLLIRVRELRERFCHLRGIKTLIQAGCLQYQADVLLSIEHRGRPFTGNHREDIANG